LRRRRRAWIRWAAVLPLVLFAAGARAQLPPKTAPVEEPAAATPAPDPLGRSTPRGSVLGFLSAARKGEDALAREYLDTPLRGTAADTLTRQLFIILDARLPARLAQVSDAPEGSRANPLTPDRERIGTIESTRGPVDVFVDRVTRGKSPPMWLFARTTLEEVPALYDEVTTNQREDLFGRFLNSMGGHGKPLAEWLVVLSGVILVYFGTLLLNRLLTPLGGMLWRLASGKSALIRRNAVPVPARLVMVAIATRWLVSSLPLSLLVREFWNLVASLLTIVAIVWLGILLNGEIERAMRGRVRGLQVPAASALVRLVRRAVDLLVIFIGFLGTLRHFGIDPTPALAGLGVGGIAVALAAQKTLENVIAGASLIFDQAVRVGDFLKMGEVIGTVDHIGLRSTRIRTLDRTVVSVPNGQIANASLETLSARDKFWFHPIVALRYETTPDQLHAVVDGIWRLLDGHTHIEHESVRVRFFRIGTFSLDVEIFAYLSAGDWNHFLELQEGLLFQITELVARSGTALALPSQMAYLSRDVTDAQQGDVARSYLPAPGARSHAARAAPPAHESARTPSR
jgi:MscS family membrane protein